MPEAWVSPSLFSVSIFKTHIVRVLFAFGSSLERGVGVLSTNCQLDFTDAALQANQVLLKLGLLLLQSLDVVVQFHVFDLLLGQVALELILNTKRTIKSIFLAYRSASRVSFLRTSFDLLVRVCSSCSFS